jgi:hypothetical protein
VPGRSMPTTRITVNDSMPESPLSLLLRLAVPSVLSAAQRLDSSDSDMESKK